MAISDKTRKILWAKSGNRCALCKCELVMDAPESSSNTIIGEECHIVAQSNGGPRADHISFDRVDEYDNLILFCRNHHKIVDDQVEQYTPKELIRIKQKHENWVRNQLSSDNGKSVSETAEVTARYCSWLRESTCTYVIPGIKNPPIPVAKCWLPLSAIELPIDNPPPQSPREALDLYMKTGKNQTGREKKYDAEWMGVGLRQVVLVGGPGSGKSLLLQRIAHREAQAGRTVLLAKLKLIASKMCKEKTSFEESLTSVSMAGYRFDDSQKRDVVQEATLLLLDGLDESAGQRNTIAADIVKWSVAHPELTIIITTRPVGHVPASLPQWPHYLLNTDNNYSHRFSEFAIDGVCSEVFKDQIGEIEQVEKRLHQVIHSDGWRNKDKDYKFVRDVPLLFSFVISLAVHGCDIPEKRMELYSDVIKLLSKDDVQDRGAETEIEISVAYIFLHYLAWLLMEHPTQEFDTLIKKTGELLAAELGGKLTAARRLSEQVFRFWEERRLLERLHHGAEELVTFMHLGFCEYAAAQYLTTLSQDEIKGWVVATRNDPRWKEVYLNAASLGLGQIIVETLLELDNPVPPDTDEAIFAAEIAAIAENIDESAQRNLLQNIMHRLISGYPTRACEAAESLLPLARKYPQLVGTYLKPLLTHADEWTRFAALALCLESGKEYIDPQGLQDKYPDLFPQSRFPSSSSSPFGKFNLRDLLEPHDLKMAIVIGATKVLLSEGVNPDLLDRINGMYEKNLSVYQTSGLSRLLKETGIAEVIEITAEHDKKNRDCFSIPSLLEIDEGGLGFLDLLLAACSMDADGVSTDGERPFIHIGKLAQVLRLGEMTYSWDSWLASENKQQALLAIRGAMLAADVEPLELYRDIVAAKKILENDKYNSLFSLLPDFPVAEDWSKCFEMCISDPLLLASAITHPCEAVGFAAAEIIAAGTVNEPLKAELTRVLSISRFNALYIISLIADHIWGDSVLDLLLSRLEQELTSGCKYLIKKIPVYSGGRFNDRILEVIKRALIAESEGVAEAAAEHCLEYIPKKLLNAELKTALFHWKEHEKPYPTSGGVIPPSPRASLVKALEQRDGLSIDELIDLYEDVRSDVKDVAKSALLLSAKKNSSVVTRILGLVEVGRLGSKTLWSLMDLPFESLRHEQQRLLKFFYSDNIDLQIVMIAALKRHQLLSEIDTTALLRQKLDSTDIAVREAASRAIRQLENVQDHLLVGNT